ncbi:addiction module protein [Myxococcus stipitatus]|uniref:addiction module protein n=1 Tax=Myxococcus stipitatus TaxID=83455 RepID=UPI0030D5FE58
MSTKDELLTSVLSLPPKERAEVARELLRSLDDPDETGDAESEWAHELDRRATDTAKAVSRQSLGRKRSSRLPVG